MKEPLGFQALKCLISKIYNQEYQTHHAPAFIYPKSIVQIYTNYSKCEHILCSTLAIQVAIPQELENTPCQLIFEEPKNLT